MWYIEYRTYLFLQSHDLEPLEVGQVSPPLHLSLLLGERALLPLLIDVLLLPQLLHWSGTSSAGEFGDDERSESGMCKGESMARDDLVLFTGRTIDQDLQFPQDSMSEQMVFKITHSYMHIQPNNAEFQRTRL